MRQTHSSGGGGYPDSYEDNLFNWMLPMETMRQTYLFEGGEGRYETNLFLHGGESYEANQIPPT